MSTPTVDEPSRSLTEDDIPSSTPRVVKIAAVLSAWHTTRIAGLFVAWMVLQGDVPPVFLIPAIGDVLVAVFAPFVAYGLWKRAGLWVWVGALIWQVIGMADLLTAISMTLLPPVDAFSTLGQTLYLTIEVVFHLIAIAILVGPTAREHFLGTTMD